MSYNRFSQEDNFKSFGFGSFTEQSHIKDEANDNKEPVKKLPCIAIVGLLRSGKTSIHKVVFRKMSPEKTIFLERNDTLSRDIIFNSSLVHFEIYDFPGNYDFTSYPRVDDVESIFKKCKSLIFVIDAQDIYTTCAVPSLLKFIMKSYIVNCNIKYEVFIHKVDGLNDDTLMDAQYTIQRKVNHDLRQYEMDTRIHVNYYLTSIYDYRIFEACSHVVQKVIPYRSTIESFLNLIVSTCGVEKAFLFDVIAKIITATDSSSSPIDLLNYESCCKMIDIVIHCSNSYGSTNVDDPVNNPAFDSSSYCVITINNCMVLYLKEVSNFLALVCIVRKEKFEKSKMLSHNSKMFRKGIREIIELRNTDITNCDSTVYKMNAEERREARRKRIIENSEIRLRKITTLSTNEIVSNGYDNVELKKEKSEKVVLNSELPNSSINSKCSATSISSPIAPENQSIFNYKSIPNDLIQSKQNLLFTDITNFEFKFSITIFHIILSQIVLVFLYCDLGFLFGHSIVVPFILSVVPELFTSNEQHDSIHLIVLLMLGFSQKIAKQISRNVKLASLIGKRFCMYIFCFVCSYGVLKGLNFEVEHNR